MSLSLQPTRLDRRVFLAALAMSVGGTAALGAVLFLLSESVWWFVLSSTLSLLSAGFYLGWKTREPKPPLYGALLAILYFGLAVAILFGGELAEKLPDPLPGLDIGDSTFFFVSPLLMLAAGFLGSILGGRAARRREGPSEGG